MWFTGLVLTSPFFNSPAHVMPLLEIVRTDKTYTQVILDFMTVGKTIKKVCVVVGNWTGFAVNGTFFSYTQGAHILANLGVDVFRIERLISSFGVPRALVSKIIAKGYYEDKKGSKPKPDLTVLPIIKELIKLTNLMPGGKIVEMIMFPVVSEACRVMEEGIVLKKWSEAYGNFFRASKFLEQRATKGNPLSVPASTSQTGP
ncbi:hypothetical protein MKW98_011913 [Papaver atlanticum]|uniref:3-hydroxyacyl-CoA dehydrogenase NAD binding domain-containing protein n=1 Tax=Papaver atlanticum TaxID=357466 RepID=A0AAD4XRW8_9MAGN|nr:hypothetical protein MKW98_011913 [Papaver atlanticum]